MLAIRKPRKYEHYNLKKIGEYPLEERLDMLKNFYKFTVVRDPIERILSAYKDKVFLIFWNFLEFFEFFGNFWKL